ncbi:MAG: response regulator [Anaerolineae bacterium]|nr:response regulator [Anaerolineae bacterium]
MTTNILVIDDSPTVGNTVGWILTDYGYSVKVASDGLSALNALQTYKPDLILLDIKLPHVDGIELCKMIRDQTAYAATPIIMLSGISAQATIDRAQEAGANNYIVKPVRDEKLITVIQQELAPPASTLSTAREAE